MTETYEIDENTVIKLIQLQNGIRMALREMDIIRAYKNTKEAIDILDEVRSGENDE